MKVNSVLALALVLPVAAWSAEPRSLGSTPSAPVTEFQGETYRLAWVHENGGDDRREIVHEYVRTTETLDNWGRLISVRWYPHRRDYREMVARLVETLRHQNPLARFATHENPDRTRTMIDFLTWDLKTGVTEFNVFLYQLGPDGQSVVAQQFAMRAYGRDEGLEFMAQLKELRPQILGEVAQLQFPAIASGPPPSTAMP